MLNQARLLQTQVELSPMQVINGSGFCPQLDRLPECRPNICAAHDSTIALLRSLSWGLMFARCISADCRVGLHTPVWATSHTRRAMARNFISRPFLDAM